MEISDIKSKLTLSSVLHHYGLKPGKQARLHCPFSRGQNAQYAGLLQDAYGVLLQRADTKSGEPAQALRDSQSIRHATVSSRKGTQGTPAQ